MLDYRNSGLTINTLVAVHSEYAVPDVLRALAAFKPQDMATVARAHLKESDVTIQETAAGILGDLPPSEENTRALAAAWPQAAKQRLERCCARDPRRPRSTKDRSCKRAHQGRTQIHRYLGSPQGSRAVEGKRSRRLYFRKSGPSRPETPTRITRAHSAGLAETHEPS